MNLKKIRTEYDLKSETEKILTKYPKLPMPDQDLLKIVFSQNVRILPDKYNNNAILFHPDDDGANCCIHYIGEKLWRNIQHPAAQEYWKYLSLSPWGNTPETYMQSVHLLILRAPLDEIVLTGRIRSPRRFLGNLIRHGWNEISGWKKLRW